MNHLVNKVNIFKEIDNFVDQMILSGDSPVILYLTLGVIFALISSIINTATIYISEAINGNPERRFYRSIIGLYLVVVYAFLGESEVTEQGYNIMVELFIILVITVCAFPAWILAILTSVLVNDDAKLAVFSTTVQIYFIVYVTILSIKADTEEFDKRLLRALTTGIPIFGVIGLILRAIMM